MGIRETVVAGPNSFYPDEKEKLEELIKNCFNFRTGPGKLPDSNQNFLKTYSAYIVPHAGLIYSGAIAAFSYLHMFKNGLPENIIILGPDHRGIGSDFSVFAEGKWLSPNGELEINSEITESLLKKSIFSKDESGHKFEHSIEVQLPFINFLYKGISTKPKIVPVSFNNQSLNDCIKAGEILGKTLEKFPSTTILTSTDFSHYVSPDFAEKYDKVAIANILDFNSDGLYRTIVELGLSLCGYGPIACCLSACNILKITESELLSYGTSGDIIPSAEVVGYGSIAFNRKKEL